MLILKYILWLIVYSVAGWVYETVLCSVQEKKFVNRGFLNGPYCPIYGFGAILDILLIGWIANPFLLFFAGMLVTCTLEYFTAWLLEVLFHAKWWDYSYMRFNIKGRVSLLGAVAFASFSVVLILFIHPFVRMQTARLPDPAVLLVTSLLLFLILADTVLTVVRFTGFQSKLAYFREFLECTVQSSQEKMEKTMEHVEMTIERTMDQIEDSRPYVQMKEFADKMKTALVKINFQEKRILKAFPRYQPLHDNDVLEKVKEYLGIISYRNMK